MDGTALAAGSGAAHRAVSMQRAAAVAAGNALEFYDFLTFTFFAIQIGRCFFPETLTSRGLLASLATFGIGFVTRPLGGIVIGRIGDRQGRKPALLWSFGLMGAGIVGVALTPSYAQIGLAAPLLLILFRLLQGFALGGEVGPSTAYLLEAAPSGRAGFYVSLQAASQGLAVLASGLVGFVLASLLTAAQLDSWGWRVAFLLGASVVPVGLYIRARLPETAPRTAVQAGSTAVAAGGRAPRLHRAVSPVFIIAALLASGAMTITNYVVSYLSTYAQDTLRFSAHFAFGATITQGLAITVVAPLAGLWCDRLGYRRMLVFGFVMLLLLAVPSYLALNAIRQPWAVYVLAGLLPSFQYCGVVALFVWMADSLPAPVRSSGISVLYAFAIAIFGGTTQFVVKALIDMTGSPMVPAWYMTTAVAVGAVALLAARAGARAIRPVRA